MRSSLVVIGIISLTSVSTRWAPKKAVALDELESQLLCALVETLHVHDGNAEPTYDITRRPIKNEADFYNMFPAGIAVGRTNQGYPILERNGSETDQKLEQQTTGETYESWQSVPLQPISLRFTFLKRVFQRTGHRLPDSGIAGCTTAGAVHSFILAQNAQKRKLAQELVDDDRGFGLRDRPNVELKSRRVTRIDQDMTVGRWKITRDALAKKGLPEFWDQVPLNERRRNTVKPQSDLD
jgi:hypothetical protein